MSSEQILAGFHAIMARFRMAPDSISAVYLREGKQDKRTQQFIEQLQSAGIKLHFVPAARLDALSKGVKHQGVVAFAASKPLAVTIDDVLDTLEEPAFLLVLDGVTDPHNLGAILRSCDGAGVHAVIAPKDRAVGVNATVRRVACGAAETVPYITVTNLARTLRQLQERGIWVVGTSDQADKTVYEIDATLPMAWVMGSEGDGMRQLTTKTCNLLAKLPMRGGVSSLNVSVASALCIYEARRQRG